MPTSLDVAPAAWVAEDRSLRIEPGQIVKTAWVPIEDCVIANRSRIAVGDVQAKYSLLLCNGDAGVWPPITGTWSGGRFNVWDGRHTYLASLMLGRERVFVAWITTEEAHVPNVESCRRDDDRLALAG